MTTLDNPEAEVGPEAFAWNEADAVSAAAAEVEAQVADHGEALAAMVALYGAQALLEWIAPAEFGGRFDHVSMRAVALVRERLGYTSPLCELAFAMQGLGSYPWSHTASEHGTTDAAKRWLPEVVAGRAVAAFALTEPGAGTDLSGLATSAVRSGDDWTLRGEKVFISNAGVAHVYTVFAVSDADSPKRRITAFAVDASLPGVHTEAQHVLGGHPIGRVRLEDVKVPDSARVGEVGRGLSVALATLHRFRPTVGAAAVGFGWRALDESIAHTKSRVQFGAPLASLQMVQARLAEMACEVEASRLLVRRAVRAIDEDRSRSEVARTGSMAKLVATESAQRVIDQAVQLHGGRGVCVDHVVARLYQDVRALRIYEGATDVQKLLIARELLA